MRLRFALCVTIKHNSAVNKLNAQHNGANGNNLRFSWCEDTIEFAAANITFPIRFTQKIKHDIVLNKRIINLLSHFYTNLTRKSVTATLLKAKYFN